MIEPEAFEAVMRRWEESMRRLNAEVCVDPFEEERNHEAEQKANDELEAEERRKRCRK